MIEFSTLEPELPSKLRAQIIALHEASLSGAAEQNITYLEGAPGSRLWVATEGDELVGVKWAASPRPGWLHSHMGAVRESHRRHGIARALMSQQHDWARDNGFTHVTTNTFHTYLPMLLLNLREGFELVGVRCVAPLPGAEGETLKLNLEKRVLEPVAPLDPVVLDPDAREVSGRSELVAALEMGKRVCGVKVGGVVLVRPDVQSA